MSQRTGQRRRHKPLALLGAGVTLVLLFLTGCDDSPGPTIESANPEPAIPTPSVQQPATAPPAAQAREETASQAPPPTTPSNPSPPPAPPNHLDEIERQLQEVEDQLNAQRNQIEQERRQKAISEYEAAMAHYLSEIEWFEASIEQLERRRATAYADFEQEYGVPFVRFNTDCGNATDFFGCINASASMPTYEFSIGQAETNIRLYRQAIDALIYPY